MEQLKVLIVDDHPVVREGFRAMLSTDPGVTVVGEASDGLEAVALVAEKRPDVVLMDLRMPNMDGIEATRQIKAKHPETAVVVLTIYDNDAYVIDAVQAGASGYLLKDASRDLLVHTIRAVSSGTTLVKTSLLYEAVSSLVSANERHDKTGSLIANPEELTGREQEVLTLVAEGCTNKEIAKKLSIAEDTAKKHVQSIIAKLGAADRTQAAMKAARAGLIQ
ncbi:MAG: response regulator transcription factor [Chloroflexota bacterium]|nr:response regulator transcription factor [Chloroflexota bacterium]